LRDRASEWLDAGDVRRRAFRRWVLVSAAGHGLLLAALIWAPRPRAEAALPGAVTVDLVAMAGPAGAAAAPRQAAPPPAPSKPLPPEPAPAKPEPPKPPPPLPPKAETVLPKTPQRDPDKPKPKAQPEPKPEPPKKPEPAKPDYDDVLASLRAERGETRPEAVDRSAAGARSAEAAGGRGMVVTPEVAGWLRAARIAVRQAWALPPGFRKQPLETHVSVDLDAQGNVLSEPKVTQRSGNPWYDESVVRAIQKASPLPAPPEPGTWPFVFRPEDLG
jgi:TonB family protein